MRAQELVGAEQAAAAALCQLVDCNDTQTAVLDMLQHPQEILFAVRALALRSACCCRVAARSCLLCHHSENSSCCSAHALGLRWLCKDYEHSKRSMCLSALMQKLLVL